MQSGAILYILLKYLVLLSTYSYVVLAPLRYQVEGRTTMSVHQALRSLGTDENRPERGRRSGRTGGGALALCTRPARVCVLERAQRVRVAQERSAVLM